MQFMYRTRGAITVFLVIIMLPTLTAAVLLVDGARYQSAQMMVQEACDIAAYSTIADYNVDLKDEFGLFAVNNVSAFEKYFKSSLGYSASEATSYSDKVHNALSGFLLNGDKYANADFLNLYNFVGSGSATGQYPLSQPEVLQSQIVDYAKFRGILEILDRFEVFSQKDKIKKEQEENDKTMEAINDVSNADSNYSTICDRVKAIQDNVEAFKIQIEKINNAGLAYIDAAAEEAAHLAFKNKDKISNKKAQRASRQVALSKLLETGVTAYSSIVNDCDEVVKQAAAAKQEYEALLEKHKEKPEICEDIRHSIEILDILVSTDSTYKEYSVVQLKHRLDDPKDYVKNIADSLKWWEFNIKSTYSVYDHDCDEIKNSEEAKLWTNDELNEHLDEVRYHILQRDQYHDWAWTQNPPDKIQNTFDEVKGSAELLIAEQQEQYLLGVRCEDLFNLTYGAYFKNYYAVDGEGKKGNEDISEDEIKKQEKDATKRSKDSSSLDENKEEEEDPIPKKELQTIAAEVLATLPSRKNGIENDQTNAGIGELNKKTAGSVMSKSKSESSWLLDALEVGRNEILTFAYIFGTFKNRLTHENVWKKPSGIKEANLAEWRYNGSGDTDLRDRAKVDQEAFFSSAEIEYIFGGNASEAKNRDAVYAWIFATRLANNIVAVYLDKGQNGSIGANHQCTALGAAASAAVAGVIPATVFKWIFIIAWATGETLVDMYYLINKGYRIPLIKKPDTLCIQNFWDVASAIPPQNSLLKAGGINVCYEDYLAILLVFVGSQKRLLRTADLIQLDYNARINGGKNDFLMTNAFTYVFASTDTSMRYLFQPVQQFSDTYSALNLGTGLKLHNEVYLGY